MRTLRRKPDRESGFCLCKELAGDQLRGFINVLHFSAVVNVFAVVHENCEFLSVGCRCCYYNSIHKENSLLACRSFSTLCPRT